MWESAKHGCPVRCLSSNLSHHFLVSSDDKGVSFVWNTETGQETSALTPGGQECPVLSTTVFSPSTKHGHPLILVLQLKPQTFYCLSLSSVLVIVLHAMCFRLLIEMASYDCGTQGALLHQSIH